MAWTKTESFSAADVHLAELARVLAHPARIAILKILAAKDTCICGDIVADLPLAQSTVSQHLKELKQAGLIKGTIDGPSVCYCIDREAMRGVRDLFRILFANLDRNAREECC